MAFLVWVSVWLLPLVTELSIIGITLKKEVEAVRKDLSGQIELLRAEIQNTVDVRTQINPQFMIPSPTPDAQLPEIEAQVRRAVEAAMRSQGIAPPVAERSEIPVSDDANYLFRVRHNLERELRKIYTSRYPDDTRRRYTSVISISRVLSNAGVLLPNLADAIREIYRACSAAVHGEDVTSAQVNFVRDVAPELLSVLRNTR
ncbi:MAG: hypothetical protein SWQ30_06795 [Thermodesulfobacteriota bacterium]|nr:hypothetical protein [Thermodesulfobacteriota bacterium]